ncbi:unnamed protein product [Closterium sp. Naga37s-1]|nr:unnamed protein product [Closterium sp. Naga37s-1]
MSSHDSRPLVVSRIVHARSACLCVSRVPHQAQSFQSYQVATAHSVLLPPVCHRPPLLCLPRCPIMRPPCDFTCYSGTAHHVPLLSLATTRFSLPIAAAVLQPLALMILCAHACARDYSKDSSYSFASSSAFYTWLNDSIIQAGRRVNPLRQVQIDLEGLKASLLCFHRISPLPPLKAVWTDPQCGDGTCTPPMEVPAVGRFGFEGAQVFTEVAGWHTLTLQLPDNDWFVSLTAPDGGVSVYVYESQPTTSQAGPLLPSASLDPAAAAAASAAPPSSPTPAPPPSSAGAPASSPSAAPSPSGGVKGRVRPSNGTGANVLLALIDGCVADGESGLQRCRQTCAVWSLCLPQLCTNSSGSASSSSSAASLPMRAASLALGSCFQACNAMLPRTSFLPPDNVSCPQAFTLFEPFVQTPSCTGAPSCPPHPPALPTLLPSPPPSCPSPPPSCPSPPPSCPPPNPPVPPTLLSSPPS